jgi:hypothetical protein
MNEYIPHQGTENNHRVSGSGFGKINVEKSFLLKKFTPSFSQTEKSLHQSFFSIKK